MIKKHLKNIQFAIFGSDVARRTHADNIRSLSGYTESIEALKNSLPQHYEFNQDEPIFIFSAGWRSGSTLLQRLICSSNDVFMWGELYDKSNIIQKMASSIEPFSASWPPKGYYKNDDEGNLSEKWIANLYPKPEQLVNSFYSFFNTLFVASISKKKPELRWGMKEVRFGFKEALFLKFLYPNCKVLFLERDLLGAYESYINFSKYKDWYSRWPFNKAFTPYAFAKHRANLIRDFQKCIPLTNGLAVKYETLTEDSETLDKIENYLGIKINRDAIKKKVGSGAERKFNARAQTVSYLERILLKLGNSRF